MRRLSPAGLFVSVLLAWPLAQLGHAVAYCIRYGGSALDRQSTGVHSDFPAAAGSSAIALLALLLGALLVIGLARHAVALRQPDRLRSSWPVLPLALTLAVIQMAVFLGQEFSEGASFALSPAGLGGVAGFGLLGQAPVALVAAIGLSWLSMRVVRAVVTLRRSPGIVFFLAFSEARAPRRRAVLRAPSNANRLRPPRRGPPARLLTS